MDVFKNLLSLKERGQSKLHEVQTEKRAILHIHSTMCVCKKVQ